MAKKLVMVIGVLFILIGLLGFVSNPIVGKSGYFMANGWHNVAHIAIGIIMLFMAGSAPVLALDLFGVIYLLLAAYGFFIGSGRLLNLVQVNSADNWLHLVLGVLLLGLGVSLKSSSNPSAPASGMPGGQV